MLLEVVLVFDFLYYSTEGPGPPTCFDLLGPSNWDPKNEQEKRTNDEVGFVFHFLAPLRPSGKQKRKTKKNQKFEIKYFLLFVTFHKTSKRRNGRERHSSSACEAGTGCYFRHGTERSSAKRSVKEEKGLVMNRVPTNDSVLGAGYEDPMIAVMIQRNQIRAAETAIQTLRGLVEQNNITHDERDAIQKHLKQAALQLLQKCVPAAPAPAELPTSKRLRTDEDLRTPSSSSSSISSMSNRSDALKTDST